MTDLTRVLFCMFVCLLLASTAEATSRSRACRVSDAVGLLAAAKAMGADGGLITLEPGEYELSEPLLFRSKSNVNIEGSGWNTVIKRKGDGDAIIFEGSCWSCRVHSLKVQGDKDAKKGSGIVFRKGEWSGINVVDYCHIDSFPENGISFEGDPKKPFSSNTVSNCWLTNNMNHQLYSYYCNDFYFTTNQFGAGGGKHPKSGAFLDHSSAGSYTLNYHWGNVVALRLGPGAHFNRIENNRLEQSSETGLLIGDAEGHVCQLNIITGNTIHTNAEGNSGKYHAVEAHNTVATTFTSNQIFSWDSSTVLAKSGVVFADNCKDWIVKDNIIRHYTEKPLVYDPKGGHIVKDNMTQ